MSVVLRLKVFGTKKKPFYRIVAMTKSTKRDGRALEELGSYDPKKGRDQVTLDRERGKTVRDGQEHNKTFGNITAVSEKKVL